MSEVKKTYTKVCTQCNQAYEDSEQSRREGSCAGCKRGGVRSARGAARRAAESTEPRKRRRSS